MEDLFSPKDLKGEKIVITAGPTQEPIDPVRFITNPSSGKMGYALATMARRRGAEVILITGPVSFPPPRTRYSMGSGSIRRGDERGCFQPSGRMFCCDQGSRCLGLPSEGDQREKNKERKLRLYPGPWRERRIFSKSLGRRKEIEFSSDLLRRQRTWSPMPKRNCWRRISILSWSMM